MDNPNQTLCLGHPRFLDADLAELAANQGPAAAWRRAFEKYGEDAPHHVAGDFAIALTLADGTSFLAVDRFAIQTLCYRLEGDRLSWAPRADAFGISELDPQAIFDYLYFHVIPSPRTVFAGVARLPAGHVVRHAHGRLHLAPYWRPRFVPLEKPDFAALKKEFLALVENAVAERLALGPAGCYLSGGTDSSTVSGMVTRLSSQAADTYSIGFAVPGYDEMEYARIAARHFGTRHHEYYVTPEDLVSGMPKVAASYDQPFGNSSAVPAYYCARMAHEDGYVRMLAGDGGDELFGGNARYAKQKVFGAYDHLPEWLRGGLLEPAFADSRLFDAIPLLKKVSSYVRQARVPMPERMQTYNLLLRMGLDTVFTPDFLARVDVDAPTRHQREVYAATDPGAALVDKMLAYDWRYTLAENDLPKVIGSARLASIEPAFPLLDDRLLEFSMKLPAEWKVKGLKLRWFFKEALRDFLPPAIITKKKHGFGLPFGPWAVEHAGLKALVREALEGLAERGIIRRTFIETLLDVHLSAHPGFYGELVWIMTMLELWLRSRQTDNTGIGF